MKTKKTKLTNHLKTGILFFGISLLLWNCQTENELNLDFIVKQNQLKVPSIEESKSNFESKNYLFLEQSSLKRKSSSNLNLSVDWEKSSVKPFNKDVYILYTPIEINTTNRMKTFLASAFNNGEVETYSLTLVYDENSTKKQFSGLIFKYSIEGEFINAYKYSNGNKLDTYGLKSSEKSNKYSRKSDGCTCVLSVADIIWMANACGECLRNMLDCVCVTGSGGNNGTFGTSNNGWSNPNNDLTNNNDFGNSDSGGGSGGTFGNTNNGGNDNNNNDGDELNMDGVEPWWAEDDQIFNELTGKDKCIYDKLKKLSLFKQTIGRFANGNYNLTFTNSGLCNGTAGEAACTDPIDLVNGNITIKILEPASQSLDYAATLLHEGIHASIYRYVDECKKGLNPNKKENLFYWYNFYKAKNARDKGTTYAQHQHMQDAYIRPLAVSLRKLDNFRYPVEDYYGFAWEGLRKYKYEDYIDPKDNKVKTMTPEKYRELIDRKNVVSASSIFAKDCK